MPTQQYIDYTNEFTARREREKQLTQRYSQKPEPELQRGLWMHSMDRYESSMELVWLLRGLIIIVLIVLALLFYLA